jgi:hypothetical protein
MSAYPTGGATGDRPVERKPSEKEPSVKTSGTGETASGGMRVVDENRGRNRGTAGGHGDHSGHGGDSYQ